MGDSPVPFVPAGWAQVFQLVKRATILVVWLVPILNHKLAEDLVFFVFHSKSVVSVLTRFRRHCADCGQAIVCNIRVPRI